MLTASLWSMEWRRPRADRRYRHAQGAAKGLEHGLGLMVGIVAAQIVDMQGHPGVIDQALEELMHRSTSNSPIMARVKGTLNSIPGRPDRSTTTRDKASSSGT
jgi:hypothetical protein